MTSAFKYVYLHLKIQIPSPKMLLTRYLASLSSSWVSHCEHQAKAAGGLGGLLLVFFLLCAGLSSWIMKAE